MDLPSDFASYPAHIQQVFLQQQAKIVREQEEVARLKTQLRTQSTAKDQFIASLRSLADGLRTKSYKPDVISNVMGKIGPELTRALP